MLLVIACIAGCVQNSFQTRYERVLHELFRDGEVDITLIGSADGPQTVISSSPSFHTQLLSKLKKVEGKWTKRREIVPMLRAAEIDIKRPPDPNKRLIVVAPDIVVFQDGAHQFFYGTIESKVWRQVWDAIEEEAKK